MTKQTYRNYFQRYYFKNREKILERTRKQRILNSRRYYEEHREEILARRKAKRLLAKRKKLEELGLL